MKSNILQPMKQTTETTHPTQRDVSFDFLRVLACLMVVVMHAQPSTSQESSLWLSFSSYATVPCIGLFFMISGALRLTRPITDYGAYFKGIFRRIVVPVLCWNVVFGFIGALQNNASWTDVTTYQFLLRLNNPTLWFIFPLLGLYLLTPILQPWLQTSSQRQQRGYLILWLCTLCLPWVKSVLSIEEGAGSIFYYFSGYVGYYLLGYYLHQHSSQQFRIFFVAFLGAWLVPAVIKLANIQVDFYEMFWYLSIFAVAQCAFWMKISQIDSLKRWLNKHQNNFTHIARLSFGIYLVHWGGILLLRNASFSLSSFLPFPLQHLTATILVFLASLVVAWLFQQNKWTRQLIGG